MTGADPFREDTNAIQAYEAVQAIRNRPSADQPLPDFDVDNLPPVIGNLVKALAANSHMLPDMPAMLSLGVLSAATRGRFDVKVPWYAFPTPSILWVGIFTPSGTNKSGIVKGLTKAYKEMQKELRAGVFTAVAESKAQIERLKKQVADAKKEGDWELHARLTLELQQAEVDAPEMPTLSTGGATPEAIVRIAGENQGRIAFISDEGGELKATMGLRYGSGEADLERILNGHGRGTAELPRKNKADSISCENFAFYVTFATQLDMASTTLRDQRVIDSGFSARFLMSYLDTTLPPIPPSDPNFHPDVPVEYQEAYDTLIRTIVRLFNGRETPLVAEMTAEAVTLLKDIDYAMACERDKSDNKEVRAFYGKATEQVARLAGLIALAQRVVGKIFTRPLEEVTVSAQNVLTAEVIIYYCLAHAFRALKLDDYDSADHDALQLIASLKKYVEANKHSGKTSIRVTKTAVRDYDKKVWRNWHKDDLPRFDAALNRAEELGALVLDTAKYRQGRGPVAFDINPHALRNWNIEEN